jgi:hypothetical protein
MQKLDFPNLAKNVPQKFQTTVISLLSCLCLSCLFIFYWLKPELIQVNEMSELIPDQGIVDQNQALQLRATIYFIRQSFYLTATTPSIWPFISSSILILGGIMALFFFFQRLVNISWTYIITGLALAIGIIAWNLPAQNTHQIYQLMAHLANIGGVLALFATTVIASATIPQWLLQVGHSQTFAQSRKNWFILVGFYWANLILGYGNTFLAWDLGIHIPSLIFGLIALTLFVWKDTTQLSLRVGLGTISLATLIHWLSSGNDAGISAWEHWNFICLGIMAVLFPLFILSNFQTPITQNLPIYKITHKAPRVPLQLIFIGTLILGIAWVFARNGSAWHQTKAALSNQSGDLAWLFQDKKQAEFDYQNAMSHSKLNGQSSFRLANLAIEAQDWEAASYYLSTSQIKHPTDVSFVGLAKILQQENQLFQSLFTLQKANQLFPENLRILTQMAYTYERLNMIDSAQYFYRKAAYTDNQNEFAHANLLYAAKKNIPFPETNNPAVQANKLAIALKNGTSPSDTPFPTNFKPSGDLRDWGYLYNAMLYKKEKGNVLPTNQWIKQGYANSIFPELNLLDAWQDYNHHKPLRALEKLSLVIETDATGKLADYKNIVDFWHKSMRMTQAPLPKNDLKSAEIAIESYPFQADLLQEAMIILNANKKEKQAYEASLQAARWNPDVAAFQWIYALQALKLGETEYAKEAMNRLFSLDPSLFRASKPVFDQELQQALARQKF